MSSTTIIGFVFLYGVVFAGFSFAQLIDKSKNQKLYNDIYLKTKTWFYIISLFLIAFSAGVIGVITTLSFVSFYAFRELTYNLKIDTQYKLSVKITYFIIPLLFFGFSYQYTSQQLGLYAPLAYFLILALVFVFTTDSNGFIHHSSTVFWSFMASIYSIGYIAKIFSLTFLGKSLKLDLVFFVLAFTNFNDVAQFTFGKLFGKHKVVPKISPNKTVEGLLGGAVTSAILFYIYFSYLLHSSNELTFEGWMSKIILFAVGFLLSILGFIGDVTLSAIKRDLHIKDFITDRPLPGHGGFWDRIDSLLFVAPCFYLFVTQWFK